MTANRDEPVIVTKTRVAERKPGRAIRGPRRGCVVKWPLKSRPEPQQMKFTHLIEINMPDNPLLARLTRDQLWRGLVLRAERPTQFQLGLDSCDITARSPQSLSRTLHFGQLVVHDTVHFLPKDEVHYQVPQQAEIPASDLRMTIEEPEPDVLFVRFEYDDHQADDESAEASFYNDFRREAYKAADIDTVRMIRQLAQEGQLDAPLQ